MQGRMTETKKCAKTKFQQSDELHCRAYTLYPPGSSSLWPGSKAFTRENNLLIIFLKVYMAMEPTQHTVRF